MSPFVRPHSVRRADRLLARAVFLAALALYTATFVGIPENPDGEVEFQTTRSLWHDGEFALGDTPEAREIVKLGFNVREGSGDREGKFYSWFGVGQAWVGLPFYGVGRGLARLFPNLEERHVERTHYGLPRSEYFEHLAVGWRNPLFGAITAWLIVLSARRFGASRVSAFVGGIAYAICTFAWPQARSSLSDVQGTLLLLGAFDLLLRFREGFARLHRPRRAQLFLFGGALGLSFLTRQIAAPAILVMGILFLVVLYRTRSVGGRSSIRATWIDLLFVAIPAVSGLLFFFYTNYQRFGDPMESGYGAAVQLGGTFFGYPPWLGALGLIAAPGKGLLWLATPIVLGLFGWVRALRYMGGFFVVGTLLLALAVAVPITFIESWYGGWTFGPRYILPCLPFAWCFVAHGMDRVALFAWGPFLIGLVCVIGLIANIGGVLVDHMTHQDLALQAMREEWPEAPGISLEEREGKRFERIQVDWRFAAPWAHWRILRHRIAGLGEEFSARELFFVDRDQILTPSQGSWEGFRHNAWVDMKERLDGRLGGVVLLLVGLLASAVFLAVRGFDPAYG